MSQCLWHQLEALESPSGFPKQPSALAIVQVRGSEKLVVVGGAPGVEQGSFANGCELDDLCLGKGSATPTDLWAKSLPSFSLVRAGQGAHADSAQGFARTVLAFPPRPRTGFSLTPLDTTGLRFLLFGGHTGQSGKHGHCLADAHVLEFIADLDGAHSPRSSSDSESDEEIFFASDYKVELKEQAPRSMDVSRAETAHSRWTRSCDDDRASHGDSDEHSDDEESLDVEIRASTPCDVFRRTLQEVSRLENSTRLKMKRTQPAKPSGDSSSSRIGEKDARWMLPQRQDGVQVPPRFGHTAVLQSPLRLGDHPRVLIHGGIDEGGVPLGDTYEVSIVDALDQPLRMEWSCVDEGDNTRSGDGVAPWDQQHMPRPRACHTAVFWDREAQPCMVVFGGVSLGLDGEPRALGDTWLFGRCGGWKRPLVKGGAPARRWGHGACLVGKSAGLMLLCGGIDASGRPLSDCWILDLEDMRWELVETLTHSPLHRSVARASNLLLAPTEAAELKHQPNLGRCTLTWSFGLKAAVVWSGQGFWTCCVTESSLAQRQRCFAVNDKVWSSEDPLRAQLQGVGTQSQDRILPSASRQLGARNASELGRTGGHQVSFSDLPDVLPPRSPSRHIKFAQPANSDSRSPGLTRVQTDPGHLESWRQTSCLVRDPLPPTSVLDTKPLFHRPVCLDRSPLEVGINQWHAKHGQSRLEPLPRR